MSRLCSSFSNILDNEETKTAAAAKNCKKNCALIQKKHDLIKAAQKKVDDSCAKNIAPDITKVSAGLDKNVQAKLRKQYNQHSKMYDGTADLPDKDFGLTTKSNQSPVLGKGGQVTDLKGSAPDLYKLSPVTEFSLSGTKLSGETPGQATTKQSPVLLASASSAKSPANTAASAKTAVSPQKAEAASENTLPVCSEGATICAGGGGLSCQKPCQSPSDPEAPGWLMSCVSGDDCVGEGGCSAGLTMTVNGECSSSCKAGSGFWGPIKNLWHNIKGETANCGENCFNPKTKCCLASKAVGEQCDGACYDPKKECCVEGKKVSKSCPCYYIGERLDVVNKRIIKYDQHLPLSQTEPGAPTIAWTSCWPWPIGPWTDYAAGFNTFDPVIQDGIRVHESEHRQQCTNMGRTRYMKLLKEKEYVLEVPAYTKERDFLKGKLTEKCK